jgi:hypothetical protein
LTIGPDPRSISVPVCQALGTGFRSIVPISRYQILDRFPGICMPSPRYRHVDLSCRSWDQAGGISCVGTVVSISRTDHPVPDWCRHISKVRRCQGAEKTCEWLSICYPPDNETVRTMAPARKQLLLNLPQSTFGTRVGVAAESLGHFEHDPAGDIGQSLGVPRTDCGVTDDGRTDGGRTDGGRIGESGAPGRRRAYSYERCC